MREIGSVVATLGILLAAAGIGQQTTVGATFNLHGAHLQLLMVLSGLLFVLIGAVYFVGGAIVHALRRLEPPAAASESHPSTRPSDQRQFRRF